MHCFYYMLSVVEIFKLNPLNFLIIYIYESVKYQRINESMYLLYIYACKLIVC